MHEEQRYRNMIAQDAFGELKMIHYNNSQGEGKKKTDKGNTV